MIQNYFLKIQFAFHQRFTICDLHEPIITILINYNP